MEAHVVQQRTRCSFHTSVFFCTNAWHNLSVIHGQDKLETGEPAPFVQLNKIRQPGQILWLYKTFLKIMG